MSSLVTSSRMYNAGARASAAWRALFDRVFADTGIAVETIAHGWPEPIEALWAKPGLVGAFMCGWPFARSARGLQPIAAPVPSPARYAGLPRYCSDFLARRESGWTRLEDAFGHRFGWMAANSQSGFNAPRAHLARFVSADRRALFSEVKGPLGNPARALEALRAREVDLIALDGFYLDLVRHHDPEKLAGLDILASTPWTAIPLLVAAPDVDPAIVATLRDHLLRVRELEEYAPLLRETLLERFAAPELAAYAALEDMARLATRLGYETIR